MFLCIQAHGAEILLSPLITQPAGSQIPGIVLLAQVQDMFEHIIAADEPAFEGKRLRVAGVFSRHLQVAHIHIGGKAGGAVEGGTARQSEFLGHQVQQGGLAGAVASVQNGDVIQLQPGQGFLKYLEWVELPGHKLVGVVVEEKLLLRRSRDAELV